MLAESQVDYVSSIVSGKLDTVFGWAAEARQAAYSTVAAIGTFPVPKVTMNIPKAPKLGSTEAPNANNPPETPVKVKPEAASFTETGQVSFTEPSELPKMEYGEAVEPSPYPTDEVPTPPTLYPQASVPYVPDKPQPFAVEEPEITNAETPALLYVDVPAFTFPYLAPFSAPYPIYVPPTPIAPIAPVITYPPSMPSDMKDRILALIHGGEDLGEVREALIDKLVETADQEAQKAVNLAFTQAAARNFSLPPGILVDGVNEIRYTAAAKIRDGMSEINNKIAQEALKNYQAGMELALVLEKAYVSLYLEYAQQILAAEKLNAQIAIELFNATVALFNAQQQARAVHAAAHRAQVQGIIAGMGAYPIAIEGAVAETAENTQRIQMYAADGGLVKARTAVYSATTKKDMAPVELYKAEVGGVKAQADIIAANVDAYRAAVTAYATGVGATSEVIEAFANETQAKSSQAQVYAGNAKAYSQYVNENVRRANTWKVFAKEQSDVLRANMQTYESAAETNQAFVRAYSAKVSAEAEIATSRASAYGAGIQAAKTYNRATVDNTTGSQQYGLIAAENLARAQALAAIARAETDRINAGARAAQTQALASLAQGSMSALHVSAGAEGSGNVNANASWKAGASMRWGGANTYSETRSQNLSA